MRKQILLIDDDLPLCRQLRDALQDDTTEVRYFIDTAEALDSFMRHRYCLVIMDPALEDMDGRELLRTMRQAKAVPILVLTNTLSLEDEVAILSSGATVCAQKPIDLHRCVAQSNALIRLYMESEHPEKQYYTLTFGTDLIIDPPSPSTLERLPAETNPEGIQYAALSGQPPRTGIYTGTALYPYLEM